METDLSSEAAVETLTDMLGCIAAFAEIDLEGMLVRFMEAEG